MGVFWLCCQLGMLTISRPETEIGKSIWNQGNQDLKDIFHFPNLQALLFSRPD